MVEEGVFSWILRAIFLSVLVPQLIWSGIAREDVFYHQDIFNTTKSVWVSVGSAATVTYGFYLLFKKWLWRWKLLQGWLVRFPDLTGTWFAKSESETFKDSYNSIITIEHKFDKLTYRGWRPSSLVLSETCVLDLSNQDVRLFIVYGNKAGGCKTNNSINQDGCIALTLLNRNQRLNWILSGEYWTNKPRYNKIFDRGTVGKIEMRWKCKEFVGEHSKIVRDFFKDTLERGSQ